jgi:hypothetical protein
MEPKDLIKALIDQALTELHVALPARIEKYDPQTLRAEVTVLAKKTLEGKPVTIPPIVEVPVAILKAGPFVIRPPYVQGDIVQVLFNERALDNILISGDPQEVGLTRKHTLDDAVVIEGLRVENQQQLPAEYTSDLLIANLNTSTKIVILNSGEVLVDSPNNVTVKAPLVDLGGAGGAGVVTSDCICAYTGCPHPDKSSVVKAVK